MYRNPPSLTRKSARVDAWPVAAIPAFRTVSDGLCQRCNSLPDLFEFLRFRELMRPLPSPPVTANVKSRIVNCFRRLRIALDSQRTCKDSHRQFALLEQTHQPPEPDAAAVLEHALGSEGHDL